MMRGFAAFANLLSVGLVGVADCTTVDLGLDDSRQEPFEVQVNVVSDPGVALAGAQMLAGTKQVGKTDASGSARVRFTGKEGDQVELTVKCPPEYESPPGPLSISLRRLASGSRPPQFEARCAPALRTVVIGVRAENGPNLPVEYLGRTVARTDPSGAALFTVRVKPLEQVEVRLNTSEKGAEQLRPQSPTLTFIAKDYDDFVVLDQNFTRERKPVHYRPRTGPQPL